MNRLRDLLRSREFHAFLFIISSILFFWQFLSPGTLTRPDNLFYYQFAFWGFLIFVMFIVTSNYEDPRV